MALPRFLSAAVAAISLCAPAMAQTLVIQPAKAEKVTETRTVALPAGSSLKVKNVNGFIRVEAWDKEEVQFTGEFKPGSKDEQVKVVLESGKNSLEIRGEYPKREERDSSRPPVCQMTLKVPRRVSPTLENVNGEIALTGTRGTANLTTVNGGIRAVDLQDSLKATTVNGGIALERVHGALNLQTVNGGIKGSALDGQGKGLKAETVNGGIRLQMAGLKGRLKASTHNGGITFNAKGAEQVEATRRRVTAVFPGSDEELRLETVNGGITLD
ncbi:DUF4097 family beta strand repeat-containing protein [Geothrix sp. 21YS21S-4]|uniref:DUF4097 family beta strand repeat-containing protein n=1 Tax=Geothrix sp. 21YS21S-4 TaxID=3068889 RepID=UPI0027B8C730|nr:DUF4097 family beta strand repeat-containing protein [Geothrix sp. 21YS21S-4]